MKSLKKKKKVGDLRRLGLGLESLLKSENVKKILLLLEKMRRGSNMIVHKINQLWYHVEIEQNWTDLYEKLWRIKKKLKKGRKIEGTQGIYVVENMVQS